MKRSIAFFDFDGTITTHDTLLSFIRFAKGKAAFAAGFMLYSPWLVAFKLKLIPNQRAKEKVLKHFFAGMPAEDSRQTCGRFAEQVIPSLVRPGALAEIARLQERGTKVVIVSASPEDWIKPWADTLGIDVMASRLILSAGRLTGRIAGANCHGSEKVRRITEKFDLADYNEILAYGDSSGDRPMLALATTAFYQPFRD